MQRVWNNAKLFNSNPEHPIYKDAVYYEEKCVGGGGAGARARRPLTQRAPATPAGFTRRW